MTGDQSHLFNQGNNQGAAPNGAPDPLGVSNNPNENENAGLDDKDRAAEGVSDGGAQGGAVPKQEKTTYFHVDDKIWPPKSGSDDEKGAAGFGHR